MSSFLTLVCLLLQSSGLYCAKLVPRLNSKTLWKLQVSLFEREDSPRLEATARVRFLADANFEPPSGKIFIDSDFSGLLRVDEKGYTCNWSLGEDKNDRKDGLWIWGLFEEPKYPYLYFTLPIFDTYVGVDGTEQPLPFKIDGSRLYCRFNHVSDQTDGVQLSASTMTYKTDEFAKADPFGVGGTVNVGEELIAGTISLTAINEDVEKLM